ncbi:MAG: hypothetical protein ACR2ML_11425 [Solirubrobacteraceae bacterium]
MDEERERTTMDDEPAGADDAAVREEEARAAAEAARIGGAAPKSDADAAHRPLEEAGEGESEGFELAEQDLEEQATHGEGGRDPSVDAFTPEVESDKSDAVYGEADEEGDPEERVEPEDAA